MADSIINLWNLYRMYWISHAIPYFRLNRMSRSRKVLWSSGISWIKILSRANNIINFCEQYIMLSESYNQVILDDLISFLNNLFSCASIILSSERDILSSEQHTYLVNKILSCWNKMLRCLKVPVMENKYSENLKSYRSCKYWYNPSLDYCLERIIHSASQ